MLHNIDTPLIIKYFLHSFNDKTFGFNIYEIIIPIKVMINPTGAMM